MSQNLFNENISYLVEKNVSVKKTDKENAVMRQTVAITLAGLNHKLNDEDIIFVYSLSDDKVKIEPDNPDNLVTTVETYHIGIYTKDNIFIEVIYSYSQNSAFVLGISKHSIKLVKPIYRNVGDPDRVVKDYEEIDHLMFKLSDYREPITLYSHEYSANKTIKEMYLEFFNRLQ